MSRKDETVRSLARGLAVLRYVNASGQAKVAEIARQLKIPRPTVYRLLDTLMEEGYITYSPTDSRVRVTIRAAGLGDSYSAASMICQAAGPVFGEYWQEIGWPLDLTIYENASMVIHETTHTRSPLSIDRGMIGYRLPMLRSSAGRAYLGHCDEGERELILQHIRNLDDREDIPFLETAQLTALLREVTKRGFAVRDTGSFRPKTSSIAVPVIIDQLVVGCISMIWIRTAMSVTEAIDSYGERLQEIAKRIALTVEST
ncbi:DNA-binding transcriptional regulator [Pelagibius sp. Alg239-R121]|uniref:DNA-binding transcriptional regulator n=1 Tax=Pelagibius sp. Alg239-R121 TaxID=2993448 RepID=UPI0024A783AC|nr:DNA-binding transcriptional regulator [Pelagibius sp. Alg239-R121]